MPSESLLSFAASEVINAASSISRLHRGPAQPCHVLLVDDEGGMLSQISALLERSGYQVSVAYSGREALRVVNTAGCQIVLTAWHMTGMDGLDLCRKIHLRADEPYTYVLISTARNSCGERLAGLSAGIDDFVVKDAPPRRSWHASRWAGASPTSNDRCASANLRTGDRPSPMH
jgi:CheY-like chemotaxis protein